MDKHDTLLIACGTPDNRRHLRSVLQERYHLLEADNTQQMLLLLRQNIDCIAALVLDVTVPEKLDRTFVEQEETKRILDRVPTILVSREDEPELLHQGFGLGAADVIPLDYEPYAMLHRIENIVELHLHKQYLEAMVQEQADILRHSKEMMVDALSSIIEYRSVESGQHILRIRRFTRILLEEVARSCPEYGLEERTVAIIASASALHDIGKIAIPDAILTKPGPLTPEEREVMKSHAITGCRILDTLGDMADREYLRYAHNICHYHHERWDGKGYPEGLAGDEIPICAQVVGLADVYDALTTQRVYKKAYPFAQAVNMILKGECGMFSPKLLECFKHVTEAFEKLARSYADGMSPRMEIFDTTLPPPRKQEENSLERVRAKYTALVHYINGLLMEVDLNRDLFHLIYNPYPELSWVNEVNSVSDLYRLLEVQLTDLEGQQEILRFFREDIRSFVEEDLRRCTRYFALSSRDSAHSSYFEITLLRTNPIDAARRTLAVLCRGMEGGSGSAGSALPILSDSTFLCSNEKNFSLIRLGSHVSRLAGYTPKELESVFGNRLMELVIPEDRENLWRTFQTQLSRGTQVETEFRIRYQDGSIHWVSDRARLSVDSSGKEVLNCILTDITGSRRAYEELNDKLRRYEIILAQTENGLFEWDLERDRISLSDTWEQLFGIRVQNGSVRKALAEGSYFHPEDLPLLLDRVADLENGSHYETAEVRVATSRGRYLWCRFRASAIRNGEGVLTKIVGIVINIDAEKQAERMLQDRADRDALTRLLNKTAGRKQVEEYLSRFSGGASCAMLIIDLDNFKEVNDRYGHLFGDAVLRQAAREIEKLFRAQDIVSRIGGDEFLVLMRGVSDRNLVAGRCQRLLNIFATTFRSGKRNLPLGCSIGIALSPEDGTDYYALFNHADQALYRAKARGKNDYCFYDKNDEAMPSPSTRTSAVGNAIDSDEEPGMAEDNMVRFAFHKLYSAKDPDQAVKEILALVGRQTNVSRVYVFENSEDNRLCSNTYEWCNEGIAPEINNLQNVSYEEDIPGYAECFDEQGVIYSSDIRELPRPVYDILEPQGIKSMLHCAIREDGVLRGYIGFDDCEENRMWTKDQIRLLQYFAETLGQYLLHKRQREQALIQAEELHTILDNQAGWLYIIDPETFEMKYCNQKTARHITGAKTGGPCYQALMGRSERCPGCPAAELAEGARATVLRDARLGIPILAEATMIHWKGRRSCLMSCRKLPE